MLVATMEFEIVQVEAYSGHRSNERPLSFVFRGNRHEVREVLDRWYEGGAVPRAPHLSYFKVITTGGEEYILRYNRFFDSWSVMISRA